MSKDDFLLDYEEVSRTKQKIELDLQDLKSLSLRGESTVRIQETIRGGLNRYAISLDSLISTLDGYQDHDYRRLKITQSEIARRKNLIADLENGITSLESQFSNLISASQSPKNKPRPDFSRPTGEETAATRDMSNAQLHEFQVEEMKRQKRAEDRIVGVTENLLYTAKDIGTEADYQLKLLDNVDGNVDNVEVKIDSTTNKVTVLIYKSND